MNLLQRYVSHGIAIGLLVFIMLAFNLSVLARTSEKRVLRVAFPQVDGMSWTAEDGTHHGMLVDYLNEIAKYTGWEYEYIYNPQNEMFRLLGTKRSFSQNETFFFSHP